MEPQILAQSGQESLATNADKNTGLAKQNDSPAGPQANTTKYNKSRQSKPSNGNKTKQAKTRKNNQEHTAAGGHLKKLKNANKAKGLEPNKNG